MGAAYEQNVKGHPVSGKCCAGRFGLKNYRGIISMTKMANKQIAIKENEFHMLLEVEENG